MRVSCLFPSGPAGSWWQKELHVYHTPWACRQARTYLIFVKGTTGGACGEQSAMWRNFPHMTNCQLEKCLHMVNMEKNWSCGEISSREKCGDKSFVAINAVISQYLFAINALLRGEKLNKKLCLRRKKDKYQVWARRHWPRCPSKVQREGGPWNCYLHHVL